MCTGNCNTGRACDCCPDVDTGEADQVAALSTEALVYAAVLVTMILAVVYA